MPKAPIKKAAKAPVSAPTDSSPSTAKVVEQPVQAAPPKPNEKLTRGGTTSGTPGQIVTAANRWRENYNPLRGLTVRRVVELLEQGQRGDYAYLQWAFRFIERRYPILSAAISRSEAPLLNFDWQIKIKSDLPPGATQAKAGAQKKTLEDAYEGIDNLTEAIKHLAHADFRGYAHLQKHRTPDGDVYHLEPLYQWCICRDGLSGNWFWNPDSRSTDSPLRYLGQAFCIGGEALPLEDFIIRTVERPIDEIALLNFVRSGLAEKDWDGFIEIYGIPGGVVTMPANIPPGKEPQYEAAAKQVSEGGSGAIPAGSTYAANDSPRGTDPFTPRLKHLDEQVVIAATGGKLTMLAESGSGTLAGHAHADTFKDIAQSRGEQVSETFQRQFDAETIATLHPGEPVLVYFELAAKDETDVAALVKDIVSLYSADKIANTEWLSEKTGYQLEDAPEPPAPVLPLAPPLPPAPGAKPKITNRAGGNDSPHAKLADAVLEDLHPAISRLIAISEIQDDDVFLRKLQHFQQDFPKLQMDILKDPSADRALLPMITTAFLKGLKGAQPPETKTA